MGIGKKILIHIGFAFLGSFIFVLLSYAVGFDKAPSMGLIDFLIFYLIPANYFCKRIDKKKDIQIKRVEISNSIRHDAEQIARDITEKPTEEKIEKMIFCAPFYLRSDSESAKKALNIFFDKILEAHTLLEEMDKSSGVGMQKLYFEQNINLASDTLASIISAKEYTQNAEKAWLAHIHDIAVGKIETTDEKIQNDISSSSALNNNLLSSKSENPFMRKAD